MTGLAAALRALADRVEVDTLDLAELVGALETLRVRALHAALAPTAAVLPVAPVPSRALAIADVVTRTGMSRGWLYREARAGRLPFAWRIGRRLSFDEAGLARWLARRQAGN